MDRLLLKVPSGICQRVRKTGRSRQRNLNQAQRVVNDQNHPCDRSITKYCDNYKKWWETSNDICYFDRFDSRFGPKTGPREHQVTILGLTIELEGTVYQTVGQDQLTSPELLEAMKNGAKPTTSQVNVGQFQETLKQFAKEGKDLLYVAFSSVLSGTYQSAVMARDLVLEDYPEAVIEIVDPKAAGIGGLSGHASSSCAWCRPIISRSQRGDHGPSAKTADLFPSMISTTSCVEAVSQKKCCDHGKFGQHQTHSLDRCGREISSISKVRGRKKSCPRITGLIKADNGGSTAWCLIPTI